MMSQFDATRYDPQKIRQHALKFDVRIFEAQIKAFVEQASAAHQTGESFIWKDPIS